MKIGGSVALVTGGSGGLGAEICRRLADNGARVAVGYRSSLERAQDVCKAIREQGGEANPVKVDHANPDSTAKCVEEVVRTFGGLDILVNNAGMGSGGHRLRDGDLDAFTPEIWEEMLGVNFSGPYFMTRSAGHHLRASNWGRVVNLSSTIGHGPGGAAAAYAPSKAAIVPLTRFLAAALAPDVTVNCVSPGLMEGTQMSGGAPEVFVDMWRDRSLLGATTSIRDVANQVLLFCQSETATGQTVVVDGGINFN